MLPNLYILGPALAISKKFSMPWQVLASSDLSKQKLKPCPARIVVNVFEKMYLVNKLN
jgi:hypothetical protein